MDTKPMSTRNLEEAVGGELTCDPQKMFDSMEDSCEMLGSVSMNWSAKGAGFGQFYFYNKDGKMHCDNEMMGREFIKKMLCQMVDDCVLTEEREDDKS